MRSPALFTAALALATLPTVAQNLSWNDAFRREDALKEALEQANDLQAQIDTATNTKEVTNTKAVTTEREAYDKLGQALLDHPEMAPHNQALISAKLALQAASASGDPAEITKARTHLADVMTARYTKATSIPELKTLIDEWEAAATGNAAPVKPEAKAEAKAEATPKADAKKKIQKVKLTLKQLQV